MRKEQDAHTFINWRQGYALTVFVIPSEDDTYAIDYYHNVLRSDVEKVLVTNRTWGDLAVDTDLLGAEVFAIGDTEYGGVRILFEVTYRTAYGDPYQGTNN